ncbi:asparagine synthase C-terminal domain-containing protein [Brevundimonas bacteroides]|uniref:asparagine synthase C-terminal domain-containing protein n=1 Tax=Brevundimonas bacteroides TaxID=74311 RepID=UPI0004967C75|nr:asparagine synthase C-terminal domain-containing protein [Brevundimonas bacteroides]
MGDFVLVVGPHPPVPGDPVRAALSQAAREDGWRPRSLSPKAEVFTCGPHPPRVLGVGPWRLIGDAFDRDHPVFDGIGADDSAAYEKKLLARIWGRFVGVRLTPGGELGAVLRDPSGALEALVWSQDGLTLVCSTWPDWLHRTLKPAWRIDVARLGHLLVDPLAAVGPLALAGPVSVGPGDLLELPLPGRVVPLWRPVRIADRRPDRPIDATARHLVSAIDEAVRGLAGAGGPIAAEVSGGLDSSLVAASLVAQGQSPRVWLNAHGSSAESDERAFVAELAARLGIAPVSQSLASGPPDEAGLRSISQGLRPGLNAMDLRQDEAWAARIVEAGAGAVLTGKGGDSVLVQGLGPEPLADRWTRLGPRALFWSDLPGLARTTERSVWSLALEARRRTALPDPHPLGDRGLVNPDLPLPPLPAWLEGAGRLGPGKAMQIAGILNNIGRHGPSRQSARIDPRHPLCALPVVEACLEIPTDQLIHGGRDRGLARLAFTDRLPPAILARRSKGDLTRLYGGMVLGGLGFLRSWLLEGRLVALGLLDRECLEDRLTREALMWRGGYAEIMTAATVEAWVRTWEARLDPGR